MTSPCTCSPYCWRITASGALPGRKPLSRAVREILFSRWATSPSISAAGIATSSRRSSPPVAVRETCISIPYHCLTRGRVVRKERLELSRVTPLEPKSSASTSSATFARPRVHDGHARGARIIAKAATADLAALRVGRLAGICDLAMLRRVADEGHKMGQIGNLVVVGLLTLASGLLDARGFVYAARAWPDGQLDLKMGLASLAVVRGRSDGLHPGRQIHAERRHPGRRAAKRHLVRGHRRRASRPWTASLLQWTRTQQVVGVAVAVALCAGSSPRTRAAAGLKPRTDSPWIPDSSKCSPARSPRAGVLLRSAPAHRLPDQQTRLPDQGRHSGDAAGRRHQARRQRSAADASRG